MLYHLKQEVKKGEMWRNWKLEVNIGNRTNIFVVGELHSLLKVKKKKNFIVHIWKYVTWLMILPDLLSHEPRDCGFHTGFQKIWRGLHDQGFVACFRNLTLETDTKGKIPLVVDPWTFRGGKGHFIEGQSEAQRGSSIC